MKDNNRLAELLTEKLPKHECGLFLAHNECRSYYESVEEYLTDHGLVEFADEESKQRAIAMNELWTLQWYPITPSGFRLIGAPTLAELLSVMQTKEREAE